MKQETTPLTISGMYVQIDEPCTDCGSTKETSRHIDNGRLVVRCKRCDIERIIFSKIEHPVKERRVVKAIQIESDKIKKPARKNQQYWHIKL